MKDEDRRARSDAARERFRQAGQALGDTIRAAQARSVDGSIFGIDKDPNTDHSLDVTLDPTLWRGSLEDLSKDLLKSRHVIGQLKQEIAGLKFIIAENTRCHAETMADIDNAIHGLPVVRMEYAPGLKTHAADIVEMQAELVRLRAGLAS